MHRTRPARTALNVHWPCNTADAYHLFEILSDARISATTRRRVGHFMHAIGAFDENEFAIAEERLTLAPQSEWTTVDVTPDGWTDKVHVQFRNIIVLMAGVLRSRQLCSKTGAVWAAEVEKDDKTGPEGYLADVCNGLWYDTAARSCAKPVSDLLIHWPVSMSELLLHSPMSMSELQIHWPVSMNELLQHWPVYGNSGCECLSCCCYTGQCRCMSLFDSGECTCIVNP